RGLGSLTDLLVDAILERLELVSGGQLLRKHIVLQERKRIAPGFLAKYSFRLVSALVVGKGMRVGANHVPMQQRRLTTGADVFDGATGCLKRLHKIRTVAFEAEEVGKSAHQPRDAASRSLHVHRHRD